MNKKIPLGAAIAFMVVIAGITFCITMMVSLNHFNTMVLNVKEREEQYKKLADVDREVRQNFAGTIDEDYLSDAISSGFIRGLGDKYSSYLTREQYEERLLDQKGQRVSIGITIEQDATGYPKVASVLENSPAALNGMLTGDLLISIDNIDLKTSSISAAEKMLKGQPGTTIGVVFRRDGVDTALELQRKDMEMAYVSSRMIGRNGYIKIDEFNEKTTDQFKRAVNQMISQGANALIFDVRDNSSDSIDVANDVLDILLPHGELGSIVDNTGVVPSSGTSDQYEIELPMCVLMNSRTSSAAEYFVGALMDFEKITSVGTTTYGKSAIQQLLPLNDGSAISLTVAHFLTPKGTDISNVGIKPTYEVKLSTEQEQTFATLNEDTDPQLKKAVEIANSLGGTD